MNPGEEPIEDDEWLYRRIPDSTGWYRPNETPPIEPEAFRANKNDTTGISIWRAKYTTIEEAGAGRKGKTYWVAVFQAKEVFAGGMDIEPRPLDDGLGHAEIVSLNYENRRSRQSIEWRLELVEAVERIEGPFAS